MKRIFLLMSFISFNIFVLCAQDINKTPPKSIMEALSINGDGLGIVNINQPEHVRSLVESPVENIRGILSSDGSVYTMRGYRIQLYNGNLPQSKNEAYVRSENVKNKFPNLSCYITYKAPFWRLLVGDFPKEADAREMLGIVVKELPQYRKEMYVVPSKIRVVPNSF